jgi:ABC-type transport system substrate-binding protein
VNRSAYIRGLSGRLGLRRLLVAGAGAFDLCTWIVGLTFDDPDTCFGSFVSSKATVNWSKIHDPEINTLFDRQSQTLDSAQRKELSQQLEIKSLTIFH